VDNGSGLGGLQTPRIGSPEPRSFSSGPVYTFPPEGPITQQELPNFLMAGPRIHPSRLQHMTTGDTASHGRGRSAYVSPPTIEDAEGIAHSQSISPTSSLITTTTQSIQQQKDQGLSGVFVTDQPLPLAFRVMPGPLQKVAEMTVTVSNPFTTLPWLTRSSEWEEGSLFRFIELPSWSFRRSASDSPPTKRMFD